MSIQNEHTASSASGKNRNVVISDRKCISLTGIDEVISFDENTVNLSGGNDLMTVDGQNLNITKLSLETGDVVIEGVIDGIFYSQAKQQKTGLFSRFR